jgi:hypothetical protein
MYLPDPDLHPTGVRAGRTHRRTTISGLVEYHHGDRDDVRSIIHDLHEQSTSISDEERW